MLFVILSFIVHYTILYFKREKELKTQNNKLEDEVLKRTKELNDAIEFVKEFDEFKLLNTVLFERKQFRDAILESKSVTEMSSSKAKDEMNQLIIELI